MWNLIDLNYLKNQHTDALYWKVFWNQLSRSRASGNWTHSD